MPREDTLYRALLGLLGLVAVSAVVVGGLGVYTVLSGTEIESFDASPADGGYRYEIAVAGELLDALGEASRRGRTYWRSRRSASQTTADPPASQQMPTTRNTTLSVAALTARAARPTSSANVRMIR